MSYAALQIGDRSLHCTKSKLATKPSRLYWALVYWGQIKDVNTASSRLSAALTDGFNQAHRTIVFDK